MMKRKFIIIVLLLSFAIYPFTVQAKTIKQFEQEVANYTAQLEEKKNKLAKNDQEVEQIKKKIKQIEGQIAAAEAEVKRLQEEIDKSNKEIEKKSAESKKVMEYYQISNGENVYLEYVFGAETMTDMIYRMSIIEQLTEYNDKIMKELQQLIDENNKKKEEQKKKKEELKKLEENLESEKERINADSKSIKETMPGIEDQIKAAKQQIKDLKNMGCRDDEEKDACVTRYWAKQSASGGSLPSTNGFYRPMEYGYVTQWYGGIGGHMGVDLSSSNKSITIYPIAPGQVSAKYYDVYGALVIKIRHNAGGKIIYSTYAHLRSWSVNVNQIVTENTPIGQMGSTGWSTGPHLHLEITSCDWKSSGGGCTWAEYQRRTINPLNYVKIPSSWNNR
ncbi:MAG: peptidoglycan DD-metalloendopeptidase family protein [Bacilli bacterium]|nr:peptidoglycan DD-metalloendopeptidase family protein [Bacilli bacterium]